MKLPEYNNQPAPGTPLYQDPNSDWAGIKIAVWALTAVVLFVGGITTVAYGLLN
jgi:hypothetical protein